LLTGECHYLQYFHEMLLRFEEIRKGHKLISYSLFIHIHSLKLFIQLELSNILGDIFVLELFKLEFPICFSVNSNSLALF